MDEAHGRVLTGWKQIGKYLGLSPKTLRRFEREQGLPVYRRGRTVFAHTAQLDVWLSGNKGTIADISRQLGTTP